MSPADLTMLLLAGIFALFAACVWVAGATAADNARNRRARAEWPELAEWEARGWAGELDEERETWG